MRAGTLFTAVCPMPGTARDRVGTKESLLNEAGHRARGTLPSHCHSIVFLFQGETLPCWRKRARLHCIQCEWYPGNHTAL
jgi:hypothetical protein